MMTQWQRVTSFGGIIISISKETEEKDDYGHFVELINNGIPLVMFDRVFDKIDCNKVVADDIGGAYLATEHLIKNGCSKTTFEPMQPILRSA